MLSIATRPIGPLSPPYVIAELGVNHDGSPARALELVRLAADAGADAVKVQVFRAEMLMSRASRLAAYQAAAGEADPVEMLRRLELSWETFRSVLDLAHSLGLAAIATVFSVQLVEPAAALRSGAGRGFDAWKTASPDIIHRPLLDALAETGRPLIVSTGASTLDEVDRAVEWLIPRSTAAENRSRAPRTPPSRRSAEPDRGKGAGSDRGGVALLQCVSSYPTPPHLAALEGIPALAAAYPDLVIGYSDHTQSEATGAHAVALGARILEKHFTDDTSRPGPDHAASLTAGAFRRYAEAARAAFASRTPPPPTPPPAKRLLDVERDVRAVSRQSIVAARDLRAGTTPGAGDLTFKRPGTGLEPFRLAEALSRPLRLAVSADTPLTPAHFGD